MSLEELIDDLRFAVGDTVRHAGAGLQHASQILEQADAGIPEAKNADEWESARSAFESACNALADCERICEDRIRELKKEGK